ncbi:Crp/Fnr family transcriptional regulator [Allofrancisella frigidaquae]|uniref:Crp/Fnr family transcriptional regulator n=2 Tax=Allofrancisella frigidaquae TaxID=1085644 RepID=A0A6M3HTC2_9GAMM|nr:Crp/Fnr family transcriptional regulator [Allofrancisella frigidaquae]
MHTFIFDNYMGEKMVMQISFLKTIELFSQASNTTLEKLSEISTSFFYRKNTLVMDYDQSLQTFLYVTNGWLKLFRVSVDGEEIIIDILSQDHYYGESLITTSSREEAYMAHAISDLKGFTLPLDKLKLLLTLDSNLSFSFLQKMSQKQLLLNAHIEHLSIQNAMQRVGCFLLRLNNNVNTNYQKSSTIHLPYPKNILALKLGMRPETFSRAISKLYTRCNVQIKGEYVNIPQPKKLISYVCQHCSKTFPCNLPID